MRWQLGEIGASLRVIGRELQGMLKIGSRVAGSSGAGFEDAEIIPPVGIPGREAQGSALLGNGFLQAAGGGQHLREQGVRDCIVGREICGFAQLLHCFIGMRRLCEGQGEPLAGVEVAGIFSGSGGERADGVLRSA